MTHPYEVRFTKTFIGGPLAGMQIPESVRFADPSLAHAFIGLAIQYPEIHKPCGGSPYRIDDPHLKDNSPQQA